MFNKKGASTGIGSATAIKFARLGAKLVVHGRNEDGLNKTIEQCPSETQINVSSLKIDKILLNKPFEYLCYRLLKEVVLACDKKHLNCFYAVHLTWKQ